MWQCHWTEPKHDEFFLRNRSLKKQASIRLQNIDYLLNRFGKLNEEPYVAFCVYTL